MPAVTQIKYSIVKNGVVIRTGISPSDQMHKLQVAPGERIIANATLPVGQKFEMQKVKPLGQVIKELEARIKALEEIVNAKPSQ